MKQILTFLCLLLIGFPAYSQATVTNPIEIVGITINGVFYENTVTDPNESNVVRFNVAVTADSTLPASVRIRSTAAVDFNIRAAGYFASRDDIEFYIQKGSLAAGKSKDLPLKNFNYFRGIRQEAFQLDINIDNMNTASSTRSTYFIYNDSRPLPVTLSAFTAQAKSTGTQLLWQTATETNCQEFIIERSTDSHEFRSLASLKATGGTTTQRQHYQYFDHASTSTVSYYRLKIVDTDGTFAYSPVRVISNKADEVLVAFNDHYFAYQLPAGETPTSIVLLDLTGRVLATQATWQQVSGPAKGGSYILQLVSTSGRRFSQRVQ